MSTDPELIAKTPSPPSRSELRFPIYDLADSVAAAKAIHEKGGGAATHDHLAAYLGYKSAKNGAFVNRIAAGKLFGLIEGTPGRMVITPRAQMILMPINVGDPKQALIDAFLAVPLYAAIYKEYHGKELPPEFGVKNAFRTLFGVTPGRVDDAYRAFIGSAETAGFFEVRGSRTQLIMPSVPVSLPRTLSPEMEPEGEGSVERADGGGGDGGGRGPRNPPQTAKTADDLKSEYISTLIGLLREKSAGGDIDDALMQRIEKLLGLPQ